MKRNRQAIAASLFSSWLCASSLLCASFVASAQTATATAPTQQPSQAQPWKSIPIPPLAPFHPPQPKRIVLKNGLVIFLIEDHELPFISGFIEMKGGSRDEPADKAGLVSLYGQVWRTSGTAATPGDTLDDQLAAKAAHVETGGGQAATSLSWSSFSKDFDSVFGVAMDLLQHPDFQQQKLDLAKQSTASSILRRNDDASGIAQREAVEIAYGKNNPYGRESELATVAAVTLEDLRA